MEQRKERGGGKKNAQRKKGTPRSAGKRSGKIEDYFHYRYYPNKLGRILRSNGVGAAWDWAKMKGSDAEIALQRLLKKSSTRWGP